MREYRPTELQTMKRLLFGVAEVSKRTSMKEVNAMIAEANQAAYDKLDYDDKVNVDRALEALRAEIKSQFGDVSGYELLAAIGDCLNGIEERSE